MEDSLGLAVDRGVKIVVNAGGLNPHGLAVALRELAEKVGVDASVAFVSGDDAARAAELGLETPHRQCLSGCVRHQVGAGFRVPMWWSPVGSPTPRWPSAPPRVPTAGVTTTSTPSPGATVAGHIIECGTQASGGNYAFFTRGPEMTRIGG